MSSLFPPVPSFHLRKELKVDRIESTVIETVTHDVELVFTGPLTVTVNAKLSEYSNQWTLIIPQVSGTAVGPPSAVFTAILPSWVPLPAVLASQSHPVNNAGVAAPGYVSISQLGTVTINNYTGNFTGVCGLIGDISLQYSQ